MADSNSLILLPPRHTAQTPQDSSSSRGIKPSSDDSFSRKLEKAKAHKSATSAKKSTTEIAAKPKSTATHVTKPAKEAAATDPGKSTKDAKKAADNAEEDPTAETEAQDHESQTPATPVTTTAEEEAHQAAAKKPVKIQKPVTGKTNQSNVVGSAMAPGKGAAAQSTDPSDDDGSDGKSPIDAVGDDDSDTGGGDGDDSVGDGEFGTGKIITAGGPAGKNPASANVQAAGNSAADPSAAAAAIIAPADIDADSSSVASATKSAVLKLDSHPVAGANDVSDLSSTVPGSSTTSVAGKTVSSTTATPQAQFVEENHPKIVTAIQGQLLPHGGTVQMRLDPPELGALQVTVHLKDGVMTASFETSNDDATKLLSHSLGQLKSSLEAAGVSVDKIHVEQAPRRDSSNDSESDSRQSTQDKQGQAQQDQQRREMVQRMWRKLAGGGDPLDLVA